MLQTTNQRNVIGSCTFLLNSNLNLKQILNFAPARAIFFTRCPKKSSWQNSGACLRAFFGTSYTKTSFFASLGHQSKTTSICPGRCAPVVPKVKVRLPLKCTLQRTQPSLPHPPSTSLASPQRRIHDRRSLLKLRNSL